MFSISKYVLTQLDQEDSQIFLILAYREVSVGHAACSIQKDKDGAPVE